VMFTRSFWGLPRRVPAAAGRGGRRIAWRKDQGLHAVVDRLMARS
jgi:hypothetical protein